jgi:3,4-dihydroxy 2-butanone 4-phosphate synthase
MEVIKAVGMAAAQLRSGKPVLIYDWPTRENEVDMVFYAGAITPKKVYMLRTEAGGLICFGISSKIAKTLRLPVLDNLLLKNGFAKLVNKPTSYGSRSNLSIWVNHIGVRTGISDNDRALTINKLHEIVKLAFQGSIREAHQRFYEEFYVPGHVPILIAQSLQDRCGHTELAVSLAQISGLPPSVVYAEMLSFGHSATLEDAAAYAKAKNIPLVRGNEILEYFRRKRHVYDWYC